MAQQEDNTNEPLNEGLVDDAVNLTDADIVAGDDEQFEAAEILRLAFGNAVAVVSDNGSVVVHARVKDAVSNIVDGMEDAFLSNFGITIQSDASHLATVYDERGVVLPAGVGVIVGPASVGKTPVLKWLVAASNAVNAGSAKLIRFGEPLPGYLTREADVVHVLTSHLLDPAVRIIAIDSIKDLLASMGGGLMARGIPRELFRMLSQWGTIAASFGKLIIVPLNISTDNDDALAEVESAVLSNATFAAIAQASILTTDKFIFNTTARQGEGKRRRIGKWELTFLQNGSPVIAAEGIKPVVATSEQTQSSISLTQYSVNRAIARALNKDNIHG